ncbi:Cytochrome P450 monooxygenase verC [Cladobotryum mycophilum]|uniref:Cytochrome P450 monooxygenase verC n=1 Tax=Cladobotryum mycophilum TaxID=491253 RepID=A0ABR0S7L0_9HYPO
MLSEVIGQVVGTHAVIRASLLVVAAVLVFTFTIRLFSVGQSREVRKLRYRLPQTSQLIQTKNALQQSKSSSPLLGMRDLPGVPFKWPNGQGTEKFFDGRQAARRWRNQYGPMYSIWSGFKREIVLTKPEHVQVFYKDSHMHIKATDNNSGWLFGELLGSCVGLVSQKRWQRVRKPFEPHFTRPSSMGRTTPFIHEAREFLHVINPSEGECTINTTNDLKYCPFFMVASIFFGTLTPEQRKEMYALGPPREDLFRETFMGGINRYAIAKYLPGSAMPRLRQFQLNWETFVARSYEYSIREGDGAIISLWEAIQNDQMSMQELLQTLDESLFANLDVTAHAVSWNVIRIAQHTDIQQKVRLEMQSYTQSEESYENYLCREDTLLAACILEVSRLHPILPFSNPEAADVDKIVDGYVIPRNTDVIVDAYAINVDNPYWENASNFDPYRHLGQKDQARRYNMWRFGFGPRQCLGKNVADIILRVIVAELLRSYQLDIVQQQGADGVELQADSWIGLPNGEVHLTPIKS